jgi:hypothetical protein
MTHFDRLPKVTQLNGATKFQLPQLPSQCDTIEWGDLISIALVRQRTWMG